MVTVIFLCYAASLHQAETTDRAETALLQWQACVAITDEAI
jgi:hypothetical protein